jgi:ribosome recycling factor
LEESILSEAEEKMKKAVESLRRELATIRTGRASPALVESIVVDYYGTPTPLRQIASISVPDSKTLVIQPWETKTMSSIEKAILKSDLGINPTNDGRLIRLVIPTPTEERRKDLVKLVHRKVEEGRVAVRNCRRDGHEDFRAFEKSKDISADDAKRGQERLQKITDFFIIEIEKVGSEKEKEIMLV